MRVTNMIASADISGEVVTGLFSLLVLFGGFLLYKVNNRDHAENRAIGNSNHDLLVVVQNAVVGIQDWQVKHANEHIQMNANQDARAQAFLDAADKVATELATLAALLQAQNAPSVLASPPTQS